MSLLIAALFLACGGRSGLGIPPNGQRPKDSGPTVKDGPRQRDGRPRDVRTPRDRTHKDACLPIPAGQVQGSYSGKWEGIWKCSDQKGSTIAGTLTFVLTPAGSPDSFSVKGSMNGTAGPGFPFSTSITGTMGCTSLHATLPTIVVGSGGLIYELTGSMSGQFVAYPVRSFTSGSWKAKQVNGNCSAQGSWVAQHL